MFDNFRLWRKVYRANEPMKDFPHDVLQYKVKAVEMGRQSMDEFGYAAWPNYLHKTIEHMQEIIVNPDGVMSVGALSEGNEAGNKIFRE